MAVFALPEVGAIDLPGQGMPFLTADVAFVVDIVVPTPGMSTTFVLKALQNGVIGSRRFSGYSVFAVHSRP
ncbi:hypothetical protein ACXPWS_28590 [Mycobacterium sp. BMJ-28]